MSLFSELKRRNIFKVAMAYLALGWVVIQITDVLVPALNLPDVLNSIVAYIGIIGFPFALFFAWAFELTPEGMKRTVDVEPEQSIHHSTGQKINYIIIALLAVAVVFLVYDRSMVPDTELRANTIAVMPFADMSADGSQEYFGDGIAEEILNVLVKIDELSVTSRTSSFALKNKNLLIPEIAARLNVNYIVEGSIKTSGDNVRVTAQLIDVASDEHMWSDTYDRELSDIFAIQDEISRAISGALRIELVGGEPLKTAPTGNIEAYTVYLQARQIFLSRGNEGFVPADFNRAIDLFRLATDIDPAFAVAWADLAAAIMLVPEFNVSGYEGDQHLALAKEAAQRAINLKPDLSQAWDIKGLIDLNNYSFLDARVALTHAITLDPKNAAAWLRLAQVYAAVGNSQQAIASVERAIEISPELSVNYYFLVRSVHASGDIERTTALIEQYKQSRNTPFLGAQEAFLAVEQGNSDLAADIIFKVGKVMNPILNAEELKQMEIAIAVVTRSYFEPELREQAKSLLELFGPSTTIFSILTADVPFIIEQFETSRTNKGSTLSHLYFPMARSYFQDKRLRDFFIQIGLFDYWKSNSFPDFCRAMGEDDFECQDGEGNWP